MPSLLIAPAAKVDQTEPVRPGHDGHRYQVSSSDRSKLLPLEIGVQTIKSSPYRAGLPAHRPRHLDPVTSYLPCSVPRHLSDSGKASDPADLPPSLSRLMRGCVGTPRGALVRLDREQVVPAALMQPPGVCALAAQRVGGDHDPDRSGRAATRAVVKAAISSPSSTGVWARTNWWAWS